MEKRKVEPDRCVNVRLPGSRYPELKQLAEREGLDPGPFIKVTILRMLNQLGSKACAEHIR